MTKSIARYALGAVLACFAALAITTDVYAQAETPITSTRCGDGLKSFGPPSPFGYPSYYVDQNMFALDHCDEPLSVDPLCGNPDFGDPLGEGLPLGPVPDVASGNFWAEQFYMLATANVTFTGGDALTFIAIEGVWGNPAEAIIDGDQLVFSRIRVRVTVPNSPASAGIYTVTHPYGVDTFNVTAADIAARAGIRAINFTDDCLHTVVGGVIVPSCAIATGDRFTNVLADLADDTTARISHFLMWDPPASAPAGYIGNPLILHAVTGGSCGTNVFKVEGPGIPGGVVMTDQFSLMGRQAHFCGDGFVDANLGEQCDDSNTVDTDCCTNTCTFGAAGNACNDPTGCFINGTCNGAGLCGGGTFVGCPTPTATVLADATVSSAQPNTNLGNAALVNVDASPAVLRTYYKVQVAGLGNNTLNSAKLRLRVSTTANANSNSGGRIHKVNNCTWTETGITFNNAPAFDPAILSTIGAVGLGAQVDFDLGNSITGDGIHCFAIDTLSSDGVDYRSRQATIGQPQLVLNTTCACVPPPPVCGDNIVNQPSEQCDGTSSTACPGLCSPTCTCPAPVCGDNIVNQPSEQCDGTSSAACPGLCSLTCTCPAPPAPVVATVIADATVNSAQANTNLGNSNQINVDAGPDVKRTFLKVQVTGLSGPPSQALLNLRVAGTANAQSNSGGRIHQVADCTWTETGITNNNAPAINPAILSTLGAVALNQAVSFNITGGITGNGTFCFAIDSTSTDGVDYNSRQATTVANRPTVSLTP